MSPTEEPNNAIQTSLAAKWKATLRQYLPASAVDDIYQYLNRHAVHLHITRERSSKLGDYRRPHKEHNYHAISINGNLNPYMFLLVLLHEMAHLDTYLQYRNQVQPHGHEWQNSYAQLINQYNQTDNFPENVRTMLTHYTLRIPLRRQWLTRIETELSHYDTDYNPNDDLRVRDLKPGTIFYLKKRPELLLQMIGKLRTRYQCTAENGVMSYSVRGDAQVTIVATP